MAEIGQWVPAQEAHAIQMAAIGINFREPVTSLLLSRALNEVSPIADRLGLTEKNESPEGFFGISMGHPVPTTPEIGSCEFLRRERPDFFSDKFSLGKSNFRYEDWSYTRWAVLADKFNQMVSPVWDTYASVAPVADIYAEYIDVFLAPIDSVDSVFLVIKEDSRFIARGASSPTGLWHSHSGFFEPDGEIRRLHQINIDVASSQTPDGERRLVQIRTFVNDQINRSDQPAKNTSVDPWGSVANRLQDLHDSVKADFAEILTGQAADAVSLG